MGWQALKVGELARRTGLTVRALHHYDAVGLVRPSLRTPSGHRLYDRDDVAKLQQVLSLRALGLSLREARHCLERRGVSPREVVRLHLERLQAQVRAQQQLCAKLEGLLATLDAAGEVPAERLLQTIEGMTMFEGYYTPEQLEAIKKRGEEIGPEAIRAVEAEWPELMAKVRAHMDAGTDPADPAVQALGRRWQELVNAFTGGDPGIRSSLNRLWEERGPEIAAQHNMTSFDPQLFEYVGRIHAAAGSA